MKLYYYDDKMPLDWQPSYFCDATGDTDEMRFHGMFSFHGKGWAALMHFTPWYVVQRVSPFACLWERC
jgi:hypothetical protein